MKSKKSELKSESLLEMINQLVTLVDIYKQLGRSNYMINKVKKSISYIAYKYNKCNTPVLIGVEYEDGTKQIFKKGGENDNRSRGI